MNVYLVTPNDNQNYRLSSEHCATIFLQISNSTLKIAIKIFPKQGLQASINDESHYFSKQGLLASINDESLNRRLVLFSTIYRQDHTGLIGTLYLFKLDAKKDHRRLDSLTGTV